MNNVRKFGDYPNGDTAESVTLQTGSLTAEIISHGASLRKLVVALPRAARNVVLGLGDLETYIARGCDRWVVCRQNSKRTGYNGTAALVYPGRMDH